MFLQRGWMEVSPMPTEGWVWFIESNYADGADDAPILIGSLQIA